MKVIICCISFLLLSICPSLLAMEGTGVALKVSLSGKIYKRFSFVLEEDIRPRDDFREAGWFLTTGEINYRILPNLRAGAGYMSLVRYKASEEVRNRYYLYASGSHRFGAFKIGDPGALSEHVQEKLPASDQLPPQHAHPLLPDRLFKI